MARRIGLFGGTFDPVHMGHINVCITLMEKHALDHVFFIPANKSPHKISEKTTAAEHRLRMLELAIEDIPNCSVLDIEPSYTIDTVREFRESAIVTASDLLFLLLGKDTALHFTEWKEVVALISLVQPLVAVKQSLDSHLIQDQEIYQVIKKGITPILPFTISATTIRKRLHQGLYCGHLLHYRVLQYIQQHTLYMA